MNHAVRVGDGEYSAITRQSVIRCGVCAGARLGMAVDPNPHPKANALPPSFQLLRRPICVRVLSVQTLDSETRIQAFPTGALVPPCEGRATRVGSSAAVGPRVHRLATQRELVPR